MRASFPLRRSLRSRQREASDYLFGLDPTPHREDHAAMIDTWSVRSDTLA